MQCTSLSTRLTQTNTNSNFSQQNWQLKSVWKLTKLHVNITKNKSLQPLQTETASQRPKSRIYLLSIS